MAVSLDRVTESQTQPDISQKKVPTPGHQPKTVSFLGEEPEDLNLDDEKVGHNWFTANEIVSLNAGKKILCQSRARLGPLSHQKTSQTMMAWSL